MVAVGVAATPDDVARFPFVEPPDVRAIRDGVQLLTELGALESRGDGRAATHGDRPRHRSAADGPAPGADDRRGRTARRRPRGHGHRRRAVHPGPARASRRAASAGRPDARPVRRPVVGLPQLPQPLAVREGLPARAVGVGLPAAVPRRAPQLPAAARVAGRRHPAAGDGQAARHPRRAAAPGGDQADVGRSRERRQRARRRIVVDRLRPRAPPPDRPRCCAGRARVGRRRRDHEPAPGLGRRPHPRLGALRAAQPDRHAGGHRGPGGAPAGRATVQAARGGRNEYIGARGARFAIFPGSPLSRKPPAWIMAGELVETSRLWARDAARIQPEWAEELAAHLVKRTYSEPTWSTKQGAAMASRAGAALRRPDRRRSAACCTPRSTPSTPASCSSGTRWSRASGRRTTRSSTTTARCSRRPRASSTARGRRDLVVDDDALYAFYDERIPADVVSARHFDTWWKSARRDDPGPAHVHARDARGRRRRRQRGRLPVRLAAGRPRAAAHLPVPARHRRRRRHRARPARRARPGAARGLRLDGARAARGAGGRARPVAAQAGPRAARPGAGRRPGRRRLDRRAHGRLGGHGARRRPGAVVPRGGRRGRARAARRRDPGRRLGRRAAARRTCG